MVCVMCDHRPARSPEGFCPQCSGKLDKQRKAGKREVYRYVTYKGAIVAFYPSGNGKYKPELVGGSPEKLPKSKTINLDVFCVGFDRAQVKKLKATVLSLSHAC